MAYPVEKKLVIAVASSALFDLAESDSIFKAEGLESYKEYQNKNINKPFEKGVAFPFIRRLLKLNEAFEGDPIEVILMSRNSPETGLRAFNSIQHHGLNITRAGFSSGSSHFQYLKSFNTALFLSANEKDVKDAIDNGYAAGRVLNNIVVDDIDDNELRIAFDFDGVLADDEAEKVYKESNDLNAFHSHEIKHADQPLRSGPVIELLKKISHFQLIVSKRIVEDPTYKRIIKTAIVTARNAPSHERMINTLNDWNIEVNEAFFLGGIDKSRVLNVMKPHIFFDDQMVHLKQLEEVPAVHIPFGVANIK